MEATSPVDREILLRLLPVAGSLAGLCIAAASVFNLHLKSVQISTLADDILAFDSLLFLLTSYVCFWALRTRNTRRARILAAWADGMFLFALTALVGVGFLMVYSVL